MSSNRVSCHSHCHFRSVYLTQGEGEMQTKEGLNLLEGVLKVDAIDNDNHDD